MLGCRKLVHQRAEFQLLRPNRLRLNLTFGGRQLGQGANVIAGKDRLQRHRRLRALVAGKLRVQRGHHLRSGGLFVRQILRVFEQLAGHGNPGLQALGRAEFVQQTVLQRDLFGLIHHRLALLERHLEMPVLLQLPLGRFPPFLPIVANHVGHQDLLNLVHRRFAPITVEHQLDQFQVIGRRHLPQSLQIGRLARQHVLLGNGFERFGRER